MNVAAHAARRLGVPAIFVLILLALLVSGCSSTSNSTSAYSGDFDGYGQVSARDYGYVRPANDVWALSDDDWSTRSVSRRGHRGDLWSRVRAGMKLNRYANPRIDSKVAKFRRDPEYLARLSQRAKPYLRVIVEEIERRGLPTELALLPHVESRYNPAATSHAAAAGMWQFIPSTGRIMGLEQHGAYDGRRDILASTRAALDYLEQLHRELGGGWELAMAAYNCGPRRVQSAQAANRRNGRPTDFWHLNLPSETENYVPQILAAARLVSEPAKYGLRLPAVPSTPQLEVVETKKSVDLHRVAQAGGISLTELRKLNAGLKHGRTGSGGPNQVIVPAGTGKRVSSKIGKAKVMPAVAATARLHKPATPRYASMRTSRTASAASGRIHVVRAGETLRAIAKIHKVDAKAIAEHNGMRERDSLLPGQRLRIPTEGIGASLATHKVRKGDSLATIARRYGLSVSELRQMNPTKAHDLRSGDTLRVRRSAI